MALSVPVPTINPGRRIKPSDVIDELAIRQLAFAEHQTLTLKREPCLSALFSSSGCMMHSGHRLPVPFTREEMYYSNSRTGQGRQPCQVTVRGCRAAETLQS